MNKVLSVILCAALCITLAGSAATVVFAAIQVTTYMGFELKTAWAAAIAVVLPLISMTALGVYLVVNMIKNLIAESKSPRK